MAKVKRKPIVRRGSRKTCPYTADAQFVDTYTDAVVKIYNRALADLWKLPSTEKDPEQVLTGGPGHCTWGDGNLDCAALDADACVEDRDEWPDLSDAEMKVIERSLRELAQVPNHYREDEACECCGRSE